MSGRGWGFLARIIAVLLGGVMAVILVERVLGAVLGSLGAAFEMAEAITALSLYIGIVGALAVGPWWFVPLARWVEGRPLSPLPRPLLQTGIVMALFLFLLVAEAMPGRELNLAIATLAGGADHGLWVVLTVGAFGAAGVFGIWRMAPWMFPAELTQPSREGD